MQLLATEEYYFIKSVRTILKCCRTTAKLSVTNHGELAILDDLRMLGDVHGLLGKIEIDGTHYLLLILECSGIAELEYSEFLINRIDKVVALPLLRDGFAHGALFAARPAGGEALPTKLRNHHRKFVKFVANKVTPTGPKFVADVVRFINESGNFYFCANANITLSVQRRSEVGSETYDSRYFWNRELLNAFFREDGTPDPLCHEWIVPIVYGHVCQRSLCFDGDVNAIFTLISRRSTRRAGVRYLRRGIDEDGSVANFVETEFIIHVFGHCLSFVQVRGSVPVFWSQKGYRFRPPLCINRPFDESFPVFEKHLNFLIADYGRPLVIVNLVEQRGRELCLGESYLQHILELDSPDISFLSFDFHQNCRALQFHKVADITTAIHDDIKRIGFCWLDKNGQLVRKQDGVIRTNCVDCLDRTNVVQCAISQAVCIVQATKLGLVEPGNDIFENTKLKYTEEMIRLIQGMWADHGDSISKQYAGTNALKGDVTRGGQRKLLGFMKDGYNSASRYYLCHVRDAQRQKIIDALLRGTDRPDVGEDTNANGICSVAFKEDDVDLLMDIGDDVLDVNDDDEDDEEEDEEGTSASSAPDDEEDDGEGASGREANGRQAAAVGGGVRLGAVRYDANSSDGGWVLVDELKQRIAKSRSRIRIM